MKGPSKGINSLLPKDVVILSAQRTPIGSFQGSLASWTAPQLGSLAIQACLEKTTLKAEMVDECIMGEVLTAGVGQAPARQAALGAGLPSGVPCMTINKVCGSGLKAVMLAADSLALGQSRVVVAGGQESMSRAPHLLPQSRTGYRMGSVQVIDSLIQDGLWDPYNNFHMGNAAEICVREKNISRQSQDEWAVTSYKRAQAAQNGGMFKDEIAPVVLKEKTGDRTIAEDEEPKNARFDKMTTLKPAFDPAGSITAANASKINDGAAALCLASAEYAAEKGVKPLCRILGHASFAQDPKWFTTAPAGAIAKLLKGLNLAAQDVDLWEINEAFAVVTLAAMADLKLAPEKTNVRGGAIALGHPIGASGARILTTLVHALRQEKKELGIATLCIGGGEAVALAIQNMG